MNKIVSRRLLWKSLLCLAVVATAKHGQAQTQTALVTAVESVGYTVHDMDTVEEFFTSVLTFEKVSDDEIVGQDFEALAGLVDEIAALEAQATGEIDEALSLMK